MTISMTSLENNDEDEDEDIEKTIYLKKIYNENNQISISDIYDDNNDKSEEKINIFKFNITGIYITNRHIFNYTDSILKDKLY